MNRAAEEACFRDIQEKVTIPINQWFDRIAEARPEHPALICHRQEISLTYKEFREQSISVAKGLISLGVQPGEHVAVWAHNVPAWPLVQYGLMYAGAVLVTVNPMFCAQELSFVLRQSGATTLFAADGMRNEGDKLQILEELIPGLSGISSKDLSPALFPSLRRIIFMNRTGPPSVYSWNEFLSSGMTVGDEEIRKRQSRISVTDTAMIQFTSGTTGVPKGAMLTQAGLLTNALVSAWIMGITGTDTLCLTLPLFHCMGSVLGTILCFSVGATLALVEKFQPRAVLETVEACRCTAIYGVPTMFIAELQELADTSFDISSLDIGLAGATPCSPKLMRDIIEIMGVRRLCVGYGQTEASPTITLTRQDDDMEVRLNTVGSPLPGVRVKIVHPFTGEEMKPGIQGELCCHGHNVMKGYFRAPEATARTIDAEGWLHTGDLAIRREDGNCCITGRVKEMIIRGGENIYPKEIEDFLLSHPQIQDACVVGVPSARLGEEVAAFVRPQPGATLTENDLKRFCNGSLSRHKIPTFFFFVDEYPVTASGKVQKFKLRDTAMTLLKRTADESGVVHRSVILSLKPGIDSSQTVFDFLDVHLRSWGIELPVLLRAGSALSEFLEYASVSDSVESDLEAEFVFDNFSLAVSIEYRGKQTVFPDENIPPSNLSEIEAALPRLPLMLMRHYCSDVRTDSDGEYSSVQCLFSAAEREGKAENILRK